MLMPVNTGFLFGNVLPITSAFITIWFQRLEHNKFSCVAAPGRKM